MTVTADARFKAGWFLALSVDEEKLFYETWFVFKQDLLRGGLMEKDDAFFLIYSELEEGVRRSTAVFVSSF